MQLCLSLPPTVTTIFAFTNFLKWSKVFTSNWWRSCSDVFIMIQYQVGTAGEQYHNVSHLP